MKKYLYLLVAIVCMGFVSCSSDSSDGGGGSNSTSVLDGKWMKSWDRGGFYSLTFKNGSFTFIEYGDWGNGYLYYKTEGNFTVNEESHIVKFKMLNEYTSEDGEHWEGGAIEEPVEISYNYTLTGGILNFPSGLFGSGTEGPYARE